MRYVLSGAYAGLAMLVVVWQAPAQQADAQAGADAGLQADVNAGVELGESEVQADVQADTAQDPTLNQSAVAGQAEGQADATLLEQPQSPPSLEAEAGAGVDANVGEPADARTFDAQDSAEMSDRAGATRRQERRADRWRYVMHNGEWWYWTPGNYWMYHRDGQWSRYNPQAYVRPNMGRRYATGYRGGVDRGYYDSYGGRYFDDGRSYIDRSYYYDPYGRRYYYDGGSRFYGDGYGGYYQGGGQIYNRGFDGRYQNPGFRRGANIGGAIGDAIGGDVGGAIGAEIGGAIGN